MALTTARRLALSVTLCLMIVGSGLGATAQTAESDPGVVPSTVAAPPTGPTPPTSTMPPTPPTSTMPPTVPSDAAASLTPSKPSKALPPMMQVKELFKSGNCKEALNVLATIKP